MLNYIITTVLGFVTVLVVYNFVPLSYFEFPIQSKQTYGASIVTIAGTDTLSASRSVINTNFSNLNTDKAELTVANNFSANNTFTTATFTGLVNFSDKASTTLFSCLGTCYFGATATSSFSAAGALTLITPLTVANGGTSLTTFGGNNTILYTTSANTLSSESAFTYNPSTDLLTFVNGLITNASTTNASTTVLSSYSSYFGGTATTTIGTDGRISITGASTTPQRDLVVKASASVECNLTDGATITFDLSICNQGKVVLGGNRTIDFTNETQALGQGIRFIACQDATGSRTLTWDSAIRWAGGNAPTLTTTLNKCDVIAGFTTAATGTTVILLDKSLNF